MAARAAQLRDVGVNDPKNWEGSFGNRQIHIALSAFSDSMENKQRMLAIAREQYNKLSGISVLFTDHFGAQPGDLNSLGYKDGIDQPTIEGSGVEVRPALQQPAHRGKASHPAG